MTTTSTETKKNRDPERTAALHRTREELKALRDKNDGSLGRRLAKTVFGADDEVIRSLDTSI